MVHEADLADAVIPTVLDSRGEKRTETRPQRCSSIQEGDTWMRMSY